MSAPRLLILVLGIIRLVEGVAEILAPHWLMQRVGTPQADAGLQMGIRMKGGRDVALGVLTLQARGDDDRMADLAIAAAVVDVADAVGVTLDSGRTLAAPAYPGGAVLGVVVAAAAIWAHRQLRA